MDAAMLIGIGAALGLIGWAATSATSIAAYVDPPSAMIVLGGTFFTVLARSSFADFVGSLKSFAHSFRSETPAPEDTIEKLAELALRARREGFMALDSEEIADPFFRKGLHLIVDGADTDKVVFLLDKEIEAAETRHAAHVETWQTWVEVAPAMGMIGTLVGLVAMLGNMQDPKMIGPAMGTAILTTLYGAILANVVGLPIASKLRGRAAADIAHRRLVMQGLVAVARGDSPRALREGLSAGLAPRAAPVLSVVK